MLRKHLPVSLNEGVSVVNTLEQSETKLHGFLVSLWRDELHFLFVLLTSEAGEHQTSPFPSNSTVLFLTYLQVCRGNGTRHHLVHCFAFFRPARFLNLLLENQNVLHSLPFSPDSTQFSNQLMSWLRCFGCRKHYNVQDKQWLLQNEGWESVLQTWTWHYLH